MELDHTKLFDFIKILFTRPDLYKKLKSYEKAKHYFMVQRFMSINFPIQANAIQHLKVNPSEVMDYWHRALTKMFNRVPGWMYTKTKKAKNKAKNKHVPEEIIQEYCYRMKYSKRQVNDAIEMFGEPMINELKQFEKLIKQ